VTTGDLGGEGLAAALIQLAAHAEQIGGLDAREAEHHREVAARVRALAADIAELISHTHNVNATLARHTAILDDLDGLSSKVALLADRLALISGTSADDGYQPVSPPRWWKLTGSERDLAADRLSAWVDQIYRPGYGRLAAALPPCWREHSLCLYILDWLSELWSVPGAARCVSRQPQP
jgi:uncharacterized membrane protein YccC